MKTILLLISLCLILTSCATTSKIEAMKPEPDDALPLVIEEVPSYINLPVTISIKDIEYQVNKFTSGIIYEDNQIADDNLEVRVWKQASIKMEETNGKIKTVLPLKVQAKYRIGTSKLGFDLYTTQEFNLNGTLTLVSQMALNNWKISTQTAIESLTWNEMPTANILGKNVPITMLVNPAIKLFKPRIEKIIDESIEKSVDFKPQVLDALSKMAVPYLINEQYSTWLRIVPSELYSTTSVVKNEKISLQLGLKCNLETTIGEKPQPKFERDKIALKQVSKIDQSLSANVVAVSTYADASKLISNNFSGKEFTSGNRKVTVNEVALWHKAGKIVISLGLSGSINGKVYLTGIPTYNEQTQEIYFDALDYALDTKNKILRTANWLAQGLILKKIAETCKYSIKTNLEEGKKSIMPYLSNYTPVPGVFINGTLTEVKFHKLQISNKAIIAVLKATGSLKVDINGLK